MRQTGSSSGMTRVEIGVVAVLLFLVAVVGWPTWESMQRRAARRQSCDNMRQWGIALQLSVIEHGGRLPSLGWDDQQGLVLQDPQAWFNRLPLYLESVPLCDLIDSPTGQPSSLWINPAIPSATLTTRHLFFHYAMNAQLSESSGSGLPVASLRDPPSTVVMAEVAGPRSAFSPAEVYPAFGDGRDLLAPTRAAHFLFTDGRVELIRRSRYDPACGAPSLQPDSPDEGFTFLP